MKLYQARSMTINEPRMTAVLSVINHRLSLLSISLVEPYQVQMIIHHYSSLSAINHQCQVVLSSVKQQATTNGQYEHVYQPLPIMINIKHSQSLTINHYKPSISTDPILANILIVN